jgi:hypothetical protein
LYSYRRRWREELNLVSLRPMNQAESWGGGTLPGFSVFERAGKTNPGCLYSHTVLRER